MGYQIDYRNTPSRKKQTSHVYALLGLTCLLFLCTVWNLWPEARKSILYTILPGDPVVTAAAFSELTEDLRSGGTVTDELKDFCSDILEGAGFVSVR